MKTAESCPWVSLWKARWAPSGEKRGDQSLYQWSVSRVGLAAPPPTAMTAAAELGPWLTERASRRPSGDRAKSGAGASVGVSGRRLESSPVASSQR